MQADWEAEFAKYRASPEYQKVNRWARIPYDLLQTLIVPLLSSLYGQPEGHRDAIFEAW